MGKKRDAAGRVHYELQDDGCFVVENYNFSKPFSNFFPGIAGLWGIPMWAFYVNRGQCITSFGIEAKDKAIMEFQPANKSYRLTALQGFRTFLKVKTGTKTHYWEPFQNYLTGTEFRRSQRLSIYPHELILTETNFDLGLKVRVNYFTLPEEPYAALVRRVSLENIGKKSYQVELIDGLPAVIPFGLTDPLIKNISRTVEAWVKVRNLDKKAPFYQLNVEVADTPQVTHIEEGNFFFSFDPQAKDLKMLEPIVEASCVFGAFHDFLVPVRFLEKKFKLPAEQQTSNRTPSALSYARYRLAPGRAKEIVSLMGYAWDEKRLNKITTQVRRRGFIDEKAARNKAIVDEIRNYAFTKSASAPLDLYAGYTFLDNILRGGLPVSLKTSEGNITFNVYSRKHGDLERDYNYFVVAPTFYSQGNGNYRDVNQNRRNDVWFNPDVGDGHVVNFLNLIQADGYNPLIVKGTAFTLTDPQKLEEVLSSAVAEADHLRLREFLQKSFLPGALLKFIDQNNIRLKIPAKSFLGSVLELCRRQELAEHGEGFWSDHWTYNLDIIESYLALNPQDLKGLLLERKVFYFYHDTHYVLPRENRYIVTDRGVRQYKSVAKDPSAQKIAAGGNRLRMKHGAGDVYSTSLACKVLCLIANKISTLDPSGIGVEMEADKPDWYDALNGLPGLMGSSISETFEIKRMSRFLLDALDHAAFSGETAVAVFEELAEFISGLKEALSRQQEPYGYWEESNQLKEQYRRKIRSGISGSEKTLAADQVKEFLNLVIAKTDKAVQEARDEKGMLATYFYHEVVRYEKLEDGSHVRPLEFKRHTLPLFLEGYVHALRVEKDITRSRAIYREVRQGGLYDRKLKMYRVNADLSKETEEIGRTRIFPPGWLENASVWLHMEYKFLLELLRAGLYDEFYENFRHVLIPFLNPSQYGRSILENSSFIVSSAHEDTALHGQGFVARLSGSTAEFLHLWLYMNIGVKPFTLDSRGDLVLQFKPALAGWLFTKKASTIEYLSRSQKRENAVLPPNSYAFYFLGAILVVYHNPQRRDTSKAAVKTIHLTYPDPQKPVTISAPVIPAPYAEDIRRRSVERIDVYFE